MWFHDRRLKRTIQAMILSLGAPLGWLIIRLLTGRSLIDELSTQGVYWYLLIGAAMFWSVFGYYVGASEERLEELSIRDALTNLYNNRYFHSRLPEEFARAIRHHRNISMILIDLDFFKKINDKYGHQAGDVVLQEVAQIMLSTARKDEIIARVGGEEFCIILIECDEKRALLAAERFLRAIRCLRIKLPTGLAINVTASMGVVSSETTDGSEWHLYAVADAAMYRAKKNGRNQIAIV